MMDALKDAIRSLMLMADDMTSLGKEALGGAPSEEGSPNLSDGATPPTEPGVSGPDDVLPGGDDPETGLPEAALKILSGNRHPPMPEKKGVRFSGVPAPRAPFPKGRPRKGV